MPIICPVCGERLTLRERAYVCGNRHCFDQAKESYVNLLRTSKPGDSMGDDKFSARSRRDFLNRGYFAALKDALVARFSDAEGSLLDICCGEGYYTSALAENPKLTVYGFDLAREMVRLAAKRGGGMYFVANMAAIPIQSGSMDYATHLFAPFHEPEFVRVLKPGGKLITVVPGARHLFGLKALLYDTPYENDEQLPQTTSLRLIQKDKVRARITLQNPADIEAVFRMTPYYFHTSQQDRSKLQGVEQLETEIEFILGTYEKGD